MKTRVPIIILPERRTVRLPVGKIRNVALRIYSEENISFHKPANLICCSDYSIRKLNREYRSLDKATDVLSFPFDDNDFLGEIYISLKRTAVQARKFGTTFQEEFLRLFVHGMLHLTGYDHMKPVERSLMNRAENHYLGKQMY